jgi:hypothetical protein
MTRTNQLRAAGLLAGLAMATIQLTATQAHAAAYCGGYKQRACKVWERRPACRPGLKNHWGKCISARRVVCGGLNQRACNLWERRPACNRGLKNHWGKCVRHAGKKDRMIQMAKAKMRQLAPTIRQLSRTFGGLRRQLRLIKRLAKYRRPVDLQRLIESQRNIQTTYRVLRGIRHAAMTVGVSSGGAVVIGGGLETGASLDAYQRRPAYLYQSKALSVGAQALVGNDIAVSAWTSRNHCIGGPAVGVTVSGDLGSGVGAVIWFDKRTGRYIGFTALIGAGSVGGGAAVITANTVVYGAPRC